MINNEYMDKGGFTLVEVLVAMSLFSFGLMAVASLAGTIIKSGEVGRRQTQAVNLAVEKLEKLKGVSYAKLQDSDNTAAPDGNIKRTCTGASPTFTCTPDPSFEEIDNVSYSWKWTVTYVDLDSDGRLAEDSGIADSRDIKRIDLTVSWSDIVGNHSTTLTLLRKV